jgi:hypothetical protein
VPLGEEVVLQSFQAADRLSGEPAHLRQLTADRSSLGPDTFADGVLDSAGQRRLELRRELGQGLHLGSRAPERGVHVALGGAPFRSLSEPLSCPCHRSFVHALGR